MVLSAQVVFHLAWIAEVRSNSDSTIEFMVFFATYNIPLWLLSLVTVAVLMVTARASSLRRTYTTTATVWILATILVSFVSLAEVLTTILVGPSLGLGAVYGLYAWVQATNVKAKIRK